MPFSGSMPACAARPIALIVNRPTPFRDVFNAPPGSDGSSTRTALHWPASDSIKARDELLPTSSSLVSSTVTGLSSNASSAIHISRIPDFMSKTPGPVARPASISERPRFAISPAGHTVSVWPSRRMRLAEVPGNCTRRWLPNFSAGITSTWRRLLEFAVKLFSEKRRRIDP